MIHQFKKCQEEDTNLNRIYNKLHKIKLANQADEDFIIHVKMDSLNRMLQTITFIVIESDVRKSVQKMNQK